jgi:hypothetical protein
MSIRSTALGITAAVICTAAAALTYGTNSGSWRLELSRDLVALVPRPRRTCPRCHGEGGWWNGGPYPDMEACPCWVDRRELRLRLRRPTPWRDEPPF